MIPHLYYKLSKRQNKMLKEMGEYFDVIDRFTKEESKAFIENKDSGRVGYETQVAKFAKDKHMKETGVKRHRNPYLMQADKTLMKFYL